MKDFWNERYAEESFAYGVLPNVLFKYELDKIAPGSILLPAEGEGRNAVYAARKGWWVKAFDASTSAKQKALRFSESQRLSIDYRVFDVLKYKDERQYDVMALIFAHFPAEIRNQAHRHLLQFLKPGGIIIFEAFSKSQLGRSSGGPQSLEMLFSTKEIQKEFKDLEFDFLEETEIVLNEGKYHNGKAAVIRFVGRKV